MQIARGIPAGGLLERWLAGKPTGVGSAIAARIVRPIDLSLYRRWTAGNWAGSSKRERVEPAPEGASRESEGPW